MGQMIYLLVDVKADVQGNAMATINIMRVTNGIPYTANSWFVNVHNGPTWSTELESRWLACDNISSVQTGPDDVQSAQVMLGATPSADEHVQGNIGTFALGRSGEDCPVLQLRGLVVRGTPHMAHIHKGGVVHCCPTEFGDRQ